MKKIAIYQDEEEIISHHAKLKETLPLIQQTYDLFKQAHYYQDRLGLADMLNYDFHRHQFKQRISQDKAQDISKALMLDGLKLSNEKVAELMENENPPGLVSAVSETKKTLQKNSLTVNGFTLTKTGKVGINRPTLKAFEMKNSVMAETPDEIELYELLMRFIDGAEKLDVFLRNKAGRFLMAKPLHPIRISEYFRHEYGRGYYLFHPMFAALKRVIKEWNN